MKKEDMDAILGLVRRMHTALDEVLEVTGELADAIQRQDQISVQLFLKLRHDPIQQLQTYQAQLRNQCSRLSPEEGTCMQQILSGKGTGERPELALLEKQVRQNQELLARILRADRRISQRMGGDKSFYSLHPEFGV
ncbi:MAG: hypothetical protein ACOX7N_01940 [Lawsonibacter sp.]|jgi:hypothetical protein